MTQIIETEERRISERGKVSSSFGMGGERFCGKVFTAEFCIPAGFCFRRCVYLVVGIWVWGQWKYDYGLRSAWRKASSCYRCNRFVRVGNRESIICADCYGGFIEEIDSPLPDSLSESQRQRFPGAAMYMIGNSDQSSGPRLRSSRRNGRDRSPFNP
ncbi:hypothetical protein Ancab_012759, partial [Ancistrocladus abbreviatus]